MEYVSGLNKYNREFEEVIEALYQSGLEDEYIDQLTFLLEDYENIKINIYNSLKRKPTLPQGQAELNRGYGLKRKYFKNRLSK